LYLIPATAGKEPITLKFGAHKLHRRRQPRCQFKHNVCSAWIKKSKLSNCHVTMHKTARI